MAIDAKTLVQREVFYCVSGLVATVASGYGHLDDAARKNPNVRDLNDMCEQALELARPIEDWEEAATQEGWQWDEGGPHFYRNRPGASPFEPYEYQHIANGDWQELCEAEGIEPYDREVFEHWIVSDWLADKLEAKGEKVDRDFAGLTVWARTTTGQAIYMDSVIEAITAELNKA
jgi:hypothetical protein